MQETTSLEHALTESSLHIAQYGIDGWVYQVKQHEQEQRGAIAVGLEESNPLGRVLKEEKSKILLNYSQKNERDAQLQRTNGSLTALDLKTGWIAVEMPVPANTFHRNEAFLQDYLQQSPDNCKETLINFGVVPTESEDESDFDAAASVFLCGLAQRGYVLQPARYDGVTGICPLYTVRLDQMDFRGPTPAKIAHLLWVTKQFCLPGQRVESVGNILDIVVLPELDTVPGA